jgi:hypothetical protein
MRGCRMRPGIRPLDGFELRPGRTAALRPGLTEGGVRERCRRQDLSSRRLRNAACEHERNRGQRCPKVSFYCTSG